LRNQSFDQRVQDIARDLVALSHNPDDFDHAFHLLNASYATPAAAQARERLKSDPAIAPLVAERYWGPWPQTTELIQLPPGSLGQSYGRFLQGQGLEPLPDPELSEGSNGDDHYLQLRIRHTHDLWHVVAGIPPTSAGEAALDGLTTEQLRWPGTALLLAAHLLHRAEADPQDGPDVGLAIAYGLELGATSQPLLAQRWEEGWSTPLHHWRQQLGMDALQQRNPFRCIDRSAQRSDWGEILLIPG
jgi:ubiquinone biosynthesis protein Coq4